MDNKGTFLIKQKDNIKYFIIDKFEETGLVNALFTTRIGGISTGNYQSLNLGKNTNDSAYNIMTNFKRIAKLLSTKVDDIVLSDQVHSTNIRVIHDIDRGKGLVKEMDYKEVDGLITDKVGITLCTFYADCVPLFFFDKKVKVIGLAHAGWRGTVNKIGSSMIDKMIKDFGCNPNNILVGIGPSIGPCCYEVGKSVYNKFNENFTYAGKLIKPIAKDKWMLNLWEANRHILKEKRILDRNIYIAGLCTSCNNDIFYSYRKENGDTGRMGAFIQLLNT